MNAGRPCQLLPGQETTVPLITRLGHVADELKVEFRVGQYVLAARSFETGMSADGDHFLPALDSRSLIVVVGDSTMGLEEMASSAAATRRRGPSSPAWTDIERLPSHWCGYEGVDALVLSTSRPEIYRKLAANNARVRAIEQRVRMGGRLVCAPARRPTKSSPPLRRFSGLPPAGSIKW